MLRGTGMLQLRKGEVFYVISIRILVFPVLYGVLWGSGARRTLQLKFKKFFEYKLNGLSIFLSLN